MGKYVFWTAWGIALAAYGVVQLGSTPTWWSVTTAIVLLVGGAVSVWRGTHDARAARRERDGAEPPDAT